MKTAVVLAGGSGSRMWPYAEIRNKAMIPLASRPLLEHTVQALRACGIEKTYILAGNGVGEIKSHFQSAPDVTVLAVSENEGAAQTLLAAQPHVAEDFIALYGDVYFEQEDLEAFLRQTQPGRTSVWVAPLGAESSGAYVCCTVEQGRLTEIAGHPRGGYPFRFVGFHFPPSIFTRLADCPAYFPRVEVGMMPPREYCLESCLLPLLQTEEIPATVCRHHTVDLDKPWHILMANRLVNHRLCASLIQNQLGENAEIDPTAVLHGHVHLGKNSRIGPHVIVEGNCWIGDNTQVTNGAILHSDVVIGDDCFVGNCCFVSEGSTVGNRCVVNHCAELDGILFDNVYLYHYMEIFGIVGQNTDIGAATVCGSLRFDDGETTINVKGRKEIPVDYANASFIGDFCRTGVNAVLSPGRRIGVYSVIGAGTILNEDIPNHTLVYPKQELVRKPWGSERYGW